MKKILLILFTITLSLAAGAQRFTDKLSRGLIAQKTSKGVLVSWRILGEEYYDVQYNVYRDGVKINPHPLSVSNYVDASGSTGNTYSVAAVVRGVEQTKSKGVKPWSSSYMEITPKHDSQIRSTLVPNDACCADVDGDGELEILMKYDNADEINQSFPKNGPTIGGVVTNEHTILECLKMDGTVLWWINCGPNMGDFQNNEINIVGYDWDMDGKAEVVMRAADGTTIHMADGTTKVIGDASVNIRAATGGGANWFVTPSTEYLLYLNGETGKPYQVMTYPLPLFEVGESNMSTAWGDGYGHRASKHFFGAPYLDGRKPSIFIGRGIYTRHKMIAYDVNPATHQLVQRWRWNNNSNGPWKGQGYHNYSIADVDWDGRDEIVFGSMVIDDNGLGLSTTGYGHGDAHHVGDFDPYRHGQEFFGCNEDDEGFNYKNATTSQVYAATLHVGKDVGRGIAGNFTDAFPGAQGYAWGNYSLVADKEPTGLASEGVNANFRIYWDGDLLEETFNYINGKNTEGCIAKYGSWSPIYTCVGSLTNNDTKGTPCYQGDLFGDWREEIIMRTADNKIRIYSTPTATEHRNYTLWHDHQYRNAMVWQMCGYNQPPHVSYFLGKMEDITVAPPPLTMTDRTEVTNGGTIGAALNDKHVIVCETGNSSVKIENGATPYILTFNVPTWVQGSAASECTTKNTNITYNTYACNVTGGALAGNARLVKQGDGVLNLPKVDMTHTGNTDVWAGTVNFDGTMKNSPLWLNRFATLNSNGGTFKSIKALYGATVAPAGKDAIGTISVNEELYLDFGSRLSIDIDGANADKIIAKKLTTVRKTDDVWTKYGPEHIQPVLELNVKNAQAGDFTIMEIEDASAANIEDIKLVGFTSMRTALRLENGKVILNIGEMRSADNVTWKGMTDGTWDFGKTENFTVDSDTEGAASVFVNGDKVTFGDNAATTAVNIAEDVEVSEMNFTNETQNYTIGGTGRVTAGIYNKSGNGTVTIDSEENTYTGGNHLMGGTTVVKKLANEISNKGSLGATTTNATYFTMENGAVLKATEAVTNGSPIQMKGTDGGVIYNNADFVQEKAVSGTLLTKKGTGWLKMTATSNSVSRLVVESGTVAASARAASTIELKGAAALVDYGSVSGTMEVTGKQTTWTPANRQTYSYALKGDGQITIYSASEKGSNYVATRTPLQLNLTNFKGTIVAGAQNTSDGRFTLSTGSGSNAFTLNIPAGVIVQNQNRTMSIGNVTGKGTLGGVCTFSNGASVTYNTWNVGNDNDFTFEGVVADNDRFYKKGTGKMTASGLWTTTGAVTVSEGTLLMKNTSTLGTGTLTVAKGARLMGNTATSGTEKVIKNSSVTINGTLYVSSSETLAFATYKMRFNGQNVTVGTTGELVFNASKKSTSATTMSGQALSNIGTLTINGKVGVKLMPGSTYTPAVGDVIRLWGADVKTVAGTPQGVYAIPYKGYTYAFDDSHLKEGYVTISNIYKMGDVNGDGKVTLLDATMVMNHIMGNTPEAFNQLAADMDGDGVITRADADLIMNAYLGK